MMVLELHFDDDARRLAARPAHRRELERLHAQQRLMMAGPSSDDSGALLIFRVALREWSAFITEPLLN